MKLKHHNTFFTLAISALTVLSGVQSAFAQTTTSTSSTSFPANPAPVGVLIAWAICNSQKRKAIGGWLLYYYIQLFGGTIFLIFFTLVSLPTLMENLNMASWGNETIQYFLYTLSVVPGDLILIIELVVGSILLSPKFRNRKMYNALRIILATQFVFGLLAMIIDINYWPENIPFDVPSIIGSALWFVYFTVSKRVKMVFIENKWDADMLHPAKKV